MSVGWLNFEAATYRNWEVKPPKAINGEKRPLVTNEPAEFEKQLVKVQDLRKFTDHFRGI